VDRTALQLFTLLLEGHHMHGRSLWIANGKAETSCLDEPEQMWLRAFEEQL